MNDTLTTDMPGAVKSVCPECLRVVDARYLRDAEGGTWLVKTCPAHGESRVLVWERVPGVPDFADWGGEHPPTRPLSGEGVYLGCPYDCGVCGQHRQNTCCVLLELTSRCDLGCPVCFASAGGAGRDPDPAQIGEWYDTVLRRAGRANIQLSGGEPTVRDDLPEIIRLGREKGFRFFQLNTNGLRLGREKDYARRLKEAGLDCVFLQFDGLDERANRALCGRALLPEKLAALENCAAARLSVVLVPVLVPGVNLDQVGPILDFAMRRLPAVRGVHFQPLSYFGRWSGDLPPERRLTLPRLLREIELQTAGRLRAAWFLPAAAEHSRCSFSGNFLLEPDGSVQPLGGSACGCGPAEPQWESPPAGGADSVSRERDTVARRWGAAVPEDAAPPADPDSLDYGLWQLKNRRFSVSAMAFQDAWTLDLQRLKNCHISVMSWNGCLIPFCAYNLTTREGVPLHRKSGDLSASP